MPELRPLGVDQRPADPGGAVCRLQRIPAGVAMRPKTLDYLVWWARMESSESLMEPPSQLHVKHPPKNQAPLPAQQTVIVGPPYSQPFLRYLDGRRRNVPIRRALLKMRAPGKRSPQSLEFRICWAIVDGGQTLLDIQAVFRMRRETLDAYARRGLDLLWSLTQAQESPETPLTGSGDSSQLLMRAQNRTPRPAA